MVGNVGFETIHTELFAFGEDNGVIRIFIGKWFKIIFCSPPGGAVLNILVLPLPPKTQQTQKKAAGTGAPNGFGTKRLWESTDSTGNRSKNSLILQ